MTTLYAREVTYETGAMSKPEVEAIDFSREPFDSTTGVDTEGLAWRLWQECGRTGSVTVRAYAYALELPVWVKHGYEGDFVIDTLPSTEVRLRYCTGTLKRQVYQIEDRGDNPLFPVREVTT